MNEPRLESKNSPLKRVEHKIMRGCTRCGFCTFYCPIYRETLNESYVARGKIALMRDVASGSQLLEPGLLEHMDTCLLCRSCVDNCPTRVETDLVVRAAREEGVRQKGIPVIERILFRHVLGNRKLFGTVLKVASFCQGFLPASSGTGTVRHLPHVISGMQAGRNIPRISKRHLRGILPTRVVPPKGVETLARVGFFAGCAMEYIYPLSALRMVRFLAEHGVEVHFPTHQGCCGLPVMARGDRLTAETMALRNAHAFKGFDIVLTGCATCGATLKDYEDTHQMKSGNDEAFTGFSASVVDATEFVMGCLNRSDLFLKARDTYEGKRITWHDPCHLARYQRIREAPRSILKSLQNIVYVEMPEADRCCGLGGSFGIYHYDISRKIAARKARCIEASGAEVVTTACPGCIAQINDALIQRRMPQRAVHIMDLIS